MQYTFRKSIYHQYIFGTEATSAGTYQRQSTPLLHRIFLYIGIYIGATSLPVHLMTAACGLMCTGSVGSEKWDIGILLYIYICIYIGTTSLHYTCVYLMTATCGLMCTGSVGSEKWDIGMYLYIFVSILEFYIGATSLHYTCVLNDCNLWFDVHRVSWVRKVGRP